MFSRHPCMVSYSRENSNNGEELIANILKNSNEENVRKTPLPDEEVNVNQQLKQLNFGAKKPWILFIGLSNSGKTSIFATLFQNKSVYDCLFIENTINLEQHYICNSGFVQLNILDVPGYIDVTSDKYNFKELFPMIHAIVFVINTQSEHTAAIDYLVRIMKFVPNYNRNIYYEIFLHKSDGIPQKYLVGPKFRRVMQSAFISMVDTQGINEKYIRYHYTTIFDYSIYAAFSKMFQHINDKIDYLAPMMNITKNALKLEKMFLVDIYTKIFIASDSSNTTGEMYELSCDVVEIINDFCDFFKVTITDEKSLETSSPVRNIPQSERNCMTITLDDKRLVYMLEISPYLILLMYIPTFVFKRRAIFNYNISCFIETVLQLLPIRFLNQPFLHVSKGNNIDNSDKNMTNDKCVTINNVQQKSPPKNNNTLSTTFSRIPPRKSYDVVDSLSIGHNFY